TRIRGVSPSLNRILQTSSTRQTLMRLMSSATFASSDHSWNFWSPESWRSTGSPGLTVLIDRKSTRLNSSHDWTSYAVFCFKKKNMAAQTPLAFEPVHQLRDRMTKGEITPVEIVEGYMDRIARYDAKLHAHIAIYADEDLHA